MNSNVAIRRRCHDVLIVKLVPFCHVQRATIGQEVLYSGLAD